MANTRIIERSVALQRYEEDEAVTAPHEVDLRGRGTTLLALPAAFDAPPLQRSTPTVVREVHADHTAGGRSGLRIGGNVTVVVAVAAAVLAVAGSTALLGSTAGLMSVGLIAATLVLIRFVLHPWHLSWGATRSEASATLPGDELLDSAAVATRAVSIEAPVHQVWAWLVELGIGPGGWCRPGLLRDDDGADLIAPRMRCFGLGLSSMPGTGFEVHRIEAPLTIVSRGPDGTTWCLYLVDCGGGCTRLVSRFRLPHDQVPVVATSRVLTDLDAFLKERCLLKGVKARAESGAPFSRVSSPCVP
jgi:hypothetical protein